MPLLGHMMSEVDTERAGLGFGAPRARPLLFMVSVAARKCTEAGNKKAGQVPLSGR